MTIKRDEKERTYKGIGAGKSNVRRRFPVGLKVISGPGDVIYGYIDSNEIEGSSHPMLLSLMAQQKIGLVKNMRTGEVKLADGDVEVETALCSKTGLLLIRLDGYQDIQRTDIPDFFGDFKTESSDDETSSLSAFPASYEEKMQEELDSIWKAVDEKNYRSEKERQAWIDRAQYLERSLARLGVKIKGSVGEAMKRYLPTPCPSCRGRRSKATETIKGILSGTAAGSAWSQESVQKRGWTPKAKSDRDIKDVPIRIVTCGLSPLNVNRIGGQFVRWDQFDVSNREHADALNDKLRVDFPEEFDDRYARIYHLDARIFGDPDHRRDTRGHSGYYPETLTSLMRKGTKDEQSRLETVVFDLFYWLHQQLSDPDNLPDRITIVSMCVKGKHRSVGVAAIIEYCLNKLQFGDVETMHHSPLVGGWNTLCGQDMRGLCRMCSQDLDSKDHDAHYMAFSFLMSMMFDVPLNFLTFHMYFIDKDAIVTFYSWLEAEYIDMVNADFDEAEAKDRILNDGFLKTAETLLNLSPDHEELHKYVDERMTNIEKAEEQEEAEKPALRPTAKPAAKVRASMAPEREQRPVTPEREERSFTSSHRTVPVLRSRGRSPARPSSSQRPPLPSRSPTRQSKKQIRTSSSSSSRPSVLSKTLALPGGESEAQSKKAKIAEDARSDVTSEPGVSERERANLEAILKSAEDPSQALLRVAQLFGLELNPRLAALSTARQSDEVAHAGEEEKDGEKKEAEKKEEKQAPSRPEELSVEDLQKWLANFDPAKDMSWAELDALTSHGKKRNVIRYVGPEGPTYLKIRVNIKQWPRNDDIGVPKNMQDFTKDVWMKHDEESQWSRFRKTSMDDSFEFPEDRRPQWVLCFAIPPPPKEHETAAHVAVADCLAQDEVHTMNAKQREVYVKQAQQAQDHDAALLACVKAKTTPKPSSLSHAMLTFLLVFSHVCGVVDASVHAQHMVPHDMLTSTTQFSNLQDTVDCTVIRLPAEDRSTRLGESMCDAVIQALDSTRTTVVVDEQCTMRWQELEQAGLEVPVNHGVGDFSFATNNPDIVDEILGWCNGCNKHDTPKSIDHVQEGELIDFVQHHLKEHIQQFNQALNAFPAELDQEGRLQAEGLETLDEPDDVSAKRQADEEDEMIEQLPLPGNPKEERERREAWLGIPQAARAAIRRMHRMFGHCTTGTLAQILRQAKAEPEYIKAAQHFRCETCDSVKSQTRAHPVAPPSMYTFNHNLSIDVFEIADVQGTRYSVLSIVDTGTSFHQAAVVSVGGGQPSSLTCWKKFQRVWSQWAGFPVMVTTDRGLHNRGSFARGLTANGVYMRQAALESPWQLGKGERQGGILKILMKKLIADQHASSKEEVKNLLSTALVTKNGYMKRGGFTAAQWVLGKAPREPGALLNDDEIGQLGVLQDQTDGAPEFQKRAEARFTAQKTLVRLDCHRRVKAALLRKSGPLVGDYKAGDIVCFQRDQGNATGHPTGQWHGPAKIIGFDGKSVWLQHETVPILTSVERLRPCTSKELLAHHLLSGRTFRQQELSRDDQQGYVDARGTHQPRGGDADSEDELLRMIPPTPRPRTSAPMTPRPRVTIDVPMTEIATRRTRDEPGLTTPRIARRRLEPRPEESRATLGVPAEPEAETFVDTPQREPGPSNATGSNQEPVDPGMLPMDEFTGFIANRTYSRKKSVQSKLIRFDKCDEKMKAELRKSRASEWGKWRDFDAVECIPNEMAEALIREGHQVIGCQWVETDKNEHLKGTTQYEMKLKSRLVVRGDEEKCIDDLRSDSPTADAEAFALVVSFAASKRVRLRSGDITNAYFQGHAAERLTLLRLPKGSGKEGMEGVTSDYLLIKKPIYGMKDSGRVFWRTLRERALQSGWKENFVFKALYQLHKDGKLIGMFISHVDDLLWACTPEAEPSMQAILDSFKVGKIEEGSFRYCGKELVQDDDYSITVRCEHTTNKLGSIKFQKGKRDKPSENEVQQLKSVVGSIAWIARQARPDLSYRTSVLQSAGKDPTFATLKLANKTVEIAKAKAQQGIRYEAGSVDWDNMIVVAMADASHSNEIEVIGTRTEAYRSQSGRLLMLASPDILSGNELKYHLMSWSSTLIRRVCRSTMQAETYSMSHMVEEGDRFRAGLTDALYGINPTTWEKQAAESLRMLWLTDCRSLRDALLKPVMGKIVDKRLGIELAALRQSIWRRKGNDRDNVQAEDSLPTDAEFTDRVQWIDTDVMAADALTKIMDTSSLSTFVTTNQWSLEQPHESKLKKKAKQLARRKTPADPEVETEGVEEDTT